MEIVRKDGSRVAIDWVTGRSCSLNVSGDCSAKRPNKSLVGGVPVVVRLEGKRTEDEVRVLSADEVSGGTSKVRNMTCAQRLLF